LGFARRPSHESSLCGGYAKEELERAGAHLVYDDPAELWENLAELGINEIEVTIEESKAKIIALKTKQRRSQKHQKSRRCRGKKRTIAHLPKSVRTALGKKGAQAAKRKRS
jgi:ribosomal protein L29